MMIVTLALNACSPDIPPESYSTSTPTIVQTPVLPTATPVTVKSPTPVSDAVTPDSTSTPAPVPTEHPITQFFPDAELVYSPTSIGFDTAEYLQTVDGYLNSYRQYLMITGWTSAADIVSRVAWENSINPRLLLALLEYQSGAVLGQPPDPENYLNALGAVDYYRSDLYGQLTWAVRALSNGFYGWREGTLTEISFSDGTIFRPLPESNAGSVALQYYFAQFDDHALWERSLDPNQGFFTQYASMFPGAWQHAQTVEPLIPDDLRQPSLNLPFEVGKTWALTGGPHPAFEGNGPFAALDFAPSMNESGCVPSNAWAVAMADGLVVRSDQGVVIQDLDGDGYQQTGWVLMYVHLAEQDLVSEGTFLSSGQKIGHPSCDGGRATGTHLHVARKYNGVWITADSAVPFVLDGWIAHAGAKSYLGKLTRGDEVVTAHQFGSFISKITRDE
ncbi:MAG: peptidoglycan DD-metalloendopeptidase family protein [Chloroflexota bacterium]